MGGGESKQSQLLKYGGLLSETERETLRAVFGNIAGDTEANTTSPQQFKVYYCMLIVQTCSLYFQNYFSQIGVTGEFQHGLFKAFCSSDNTAAKTALDGLTFVNFIQNAGNILKGSTSHKAAFFSTMCQHVGDGTAATGQSIQTVLLFMLSFLTDSELGKKMFPQLSEWKHDVESNGVLVKYWLKMLIKGDTKGTVPVTSDKIERWFNNCSLLLRIYEIVFTLLLFGQLMALDDIRKTLGTSTIVEDGEELNTENFLYPLKLPPITHGHNDNFSSTILDRAMVIGLNSFIPAGVRGKLYPLFSSVKHGESFSAMCSRAVNKGPTLLIVRDTKGYIFGVFAAVNWKFGPQFFGKNLLLTTKLLHISYFQGPQIVSYLPSFLNLGCTTLRATITIICIYSRMPKRCQTDW